VQCGAGRQKSSQPLAVLAGFMRGAHGSEAMAASKVLLLSFSGGEGCESGTQFVCLGLAPETINRPPTKMAD